MRRFTEGARVFLWVSVDSLCLWGGEFGLFVCVEVIDVGFDVCDALLEAFVEDASAWRKGEGSDGASTFLEIGFVEDTCGLVFSGEVARAAQHIFGVYCTM